MRKQRSNEERFVIDLMTSALQSMGHDVATDAEVWFVHATDGIRQLWRSDDSRCSFPEPPMTPRGHPTYRISWATLDTGESTEFDIGPGNRESSLLIPPIDPRMRRRGWR